MAVDIKSELKKKKDEKFKQILIHLYIKKDLSIRKIAEELKLTPTTVHKYIHKYNIVKDVSYNKREKQ